MRVAHGARGQALVEAALSFPLLVLLLLVIVEGALYVHALHVVLGAAREGAHAARGRARDHRGRRRGRTGPCP